ncbi:MAG: oxidoreductase, short-chain dehydrogenase/reductase family [Labilithrix sp.]|nr:oxidoreductase, short-chain dehydrogenase/reductase family [Labilithrix sp.]
MRLDKKVALVTGASRGIGRASCLALAREGAAIVAVARTTEDLDALAKEVTALGVRCHTVTCDVTKSAEVAAAVADAHAALGRIDILVNNAGIGGYRPFLEWTEADYDAIMATNAKSTWLFCKEIIPLLLAQGGGSIVNVSSVAGLQGYPNEGIYCMSKFAQVALSQSLDREFYERNIKVSLVCPGGVETSFALGDGRTPDGANMKGFSTAEDVAEAVVLAVLPRERSRIVNIIMRPMNEQT